MPILLCLTCSSSLDAYWQLPCFVLLADPLESATEAMAPDSVVELTTLQLKHFSTTPHRHQFLLDRPGEIFLVSSMEKREKYDCILCSRVK
jgi:hypothetical protein